jgi:hypothetical protein
MINFQRLPPLQVNYFFQYGLLAQALLPVPSMTLGIASIDGGDELSGEVLVVCIENREKDGGIEAKLGFGGGAEASYRLGGVGGFIRCVELPAVDPVPGGAPPSCLEARGR